MRGWLQKIPRAIAHQLQHVAALLRETWKQPLRVAACKRVEGFIR